MAIVDPGLEAFNRLLQSAPQIESDEYRKEKERERFIAQLIVLSVGTGSFIACGALNYYLTVVK